MGNALEKIPPITPLSSTSFQEEIRENKNVLARAALYLGVIILIFFIAAQYSVQYRQNDAPLLTGSAMGKTIYYKRHKHEYNLVFLGDSRTYCGIHPELIDAALGTKSINLSVFAHWFPTQFPQIQDVVSSWPQNAVMVWSIGAQNFDNVGDNLWSQNSPYYIGFKNVPRYLIWGFKPGPIAYNLYKHSRLFDLVETLRTSAKHFREWTSKEVGAENTTGTNKAPDLSPPTEGNKDIEPKRYTIPPFVGMTSVEIVDQLKRDPGFASAEIVYEKGRETSILAIRQSGAYYRIELDPEFFRKKQEESASHNTEDATPQGFSINSSYMKLFIKALDLIKEKHIHLIVNEIQEAPFAYGNNATRNLWSEQMHQVIEPEVRKRGFDYIRVDFDQLTDEDYFDYNHLNSKGVERYNPLLADQLRPLIKKYIRPKKSKHAL